MLIVESILLGINNGLAPGVLSGWVVCEALKGNTKSFVKISIAPIMFGLIIVPLIFACISLLRNNQIVIGLIAIIGAILLIYMGINQLLVAKKEKNVNNNNATPKNAIFLKSAAINFLNPYGYIFWLSVGIPLVNKAAHIGLFFAGTIVIIYYFTLVLSKISLGILIQFFNKFFHIRFYQQIIQLMGIVFIIFGIYYLYYAMHLLK